MHTSSASRCHPLCRPSQALRWSGAHRAACGELHAGLWRSCAGVWCGGPRAAHLLPRCGPGGAGAQGPGGPRPRGGTRVCGGVPCALTGDRYSARACGGGTSRGSRPVAATAAWEPTSVHCVGHQRRYKQLTKPCLGPAAAGPGAGKAVYPRRLLGWAPAGCRPRAMQVQAQWHQGGSRRAGPGWLAVPAAVQTMEPKIREAADECSCDDSQASQAEPCMLPRPSDNICCGRFLWCMLLLPLARWRALAAGTKAQDMPA
jgi:hypothetical protein